MGPGESYTRLSEEIHTARRLMVKDLKYRLGTIFKGTGR